MRGRTRREGLSTNSVNSRYLSTAGPTRWKGLLTAGSFPESKVRPYLCSLFVKGNRAPRIVASADTVAGRAEPPASCSKHTRQPCARFQAGLCRYDLTEPSRCLHARHSTPDAHLAQQMTRRQGCLPCTPASKLRQTYRSICHTHPNHCSLAHKVQTEVNHLPEQASWTRTHGHAMTHADRGRKNALHSHHRPCSCHLATLKGHQQGRAPQGPRALGSPPTHRQVQAATLGFRETKRSSPWSPRCCPCERCPTFDSTTTLKP